MIVEKLNAPAKIEIITLDFSGIALLNFKAF